jgi:cytochrome c2
MTFSAGAAEHQVFRQDAIRDFVAGHPNSWVEERAETSTNLYDLSIRWIKLPESSGLGGGLLIEDDLVIVFRPHGQVMWLDTARRQGPYSTHIEVPMNFDGLKQSGLIESAKINQAWFRVAGVHAERLSDRLRVYVTHHAFEDGCFYFQLSTLDLTFDAVEGLIQASPWKRLFRPAPCIHINNASNLFSGHQSGGRIVEFDDDHLLVAYGDHEFDGHVGPNFPQDAASPYGKIWKIAKDGSSAAIYASGVRNPQGLFKDSRGWIWETEHGPQGGDELNRIVEGANYGWPFQTYGVLYGKKPWPLNPVQGDHSVPGYVPPVFAWTPSIAPTNLVEAASSPFALWKGDLLIATLRDESVRRLRVQGDRIAYDERIAFGYRVRDITSLNSGGLALLTDNGLVGLVTPKSSVEEAFEAEPEPPSTSAMARADATPGEKLFFQHCASCHSLTPQSADAGPPLGGIVGREIGTAPGFDYSRALRNASGVWTDELIFRFVTGASPEMAGTTMPTIDLAAAEVFEILNYVMGHASGLAAASTEARGIDDQPSPDLAPFAIPFAAEGARRVHAYEELLPGFWIGFDETAGSVVETRQVPIANTEAVPSYHRYSVEVRLGELKGSKWATVERTVPALLRAANARVGVTLVAKLSDASPVQVQLYVPQRDGEERSIILGEASLSSALSAHYVGAAINAGALANAEAAPRIVIVLPLKDGLVFEIAALTVHVETLVAEDGESGCRPPSDELHRRMPRPLAAARQPAGC